MTTYSVVTRSDVSQVLQTALDGIRADGWNPRGWGLVPPWCIRQAIRAAVMDISPDSATTRNELNYWARQAVSKALNQPIGLISYWEMDPRRTAEHIEAVLDDAIRIVQETE